jgi:hypothetical protein
VAAIGRSLPIMVIKRAGQIRCNRLSERMQIPGQAECNRVVKWSAISYRNAKPRRFAASGLLFSPPSLNVWRTWRRKYQRCMSDSLLRKVDCVRSAGRREGCAQNFLWMPRVSVCISTEKRVFFHILKWLYSFKNNRLSCGSPQHGM